METESHIENRSSHSDVHKTSTDSQDTSFFGRIRTRWNAQIAGAVRERRLSLKSNQDGIKRDSPINTEDRERSSSVVRVEGATTTNPESELILMQHSYNQMTADIHLLPEAPPDMVPEIILYEA